MYTDVFYLERALEPLKGLQTNQHHGVYRSVMFKNDL